MKNFRRTLLALMVVVSAQFLYSCEEKEDISLGVDQTESVCCGNDEDDDERPAKN